MNSVMKIIQIKPHAIEIHYKICACNVNCELDCNRFRWYSHGRTSIAVALALHYISAVAYWLYATYQPVYIPAVHYISAVAYCCRHGLWLGVGLGEYSS